MSNTELIAEARTPENSQWPGTELLARLADALEAAERKYAELLIAGQPHRRANRRKNAAQTDALKADAWDEGFDAGERDVHEHKTFDEPCIQNPYRVQP